MKYIFVFLADWANGLFALVAASVITGVEIEWWYIPVALGLSHLPDIDVLPELLVRGRVAASANNPSDHRALLHYPVIAVPVCMVAALFGGFWGVVLAVVLPLHLLNDLYGTGWGLQLLWPFSRTHYKLLGRRVNRLKRILQEDGDWQRLPEGERRLRVLVRWNENEVVSYMSKWGMDEWIDRWYLRLNWVSGVEALLFLVAVSMVVTEMV